jgi:hypothetical protein
MAKIVISFLALRGMSKTFAKLGTSSLPKFKNT